MSFVPTRSKQGNPQVEPDTLVADAQVARELGGVTRMTLHRWDKVPARAPEGWPPAVKLGIRNYRSRQAIETVKANLLKAAQARRDGGAA